MQFIAQYKDNNKLKNIIGIKTMMLILLITSWILAGNCHKYINLQTLTDATLTDLPSAKSGSDFCCPSKLTSSVYLVYFYSETAAPYTVEIDIYVFVR